jgi:tetratricopeptide (TPR) repeat protein
MGVLKQVWTAITGQKAPSTVDLFRRAERFRRDGRFEEALLLVDEGLGLHPDHVLGHLLSGYLRTAFRQMDAAREEFERVLALDPYHPRALLGLARLAFEAGDAPGCRAYIERAMRAYPDFPEAQALLEVLTATTALAGPALAGLGALRPDILRTPAGSRDLFLAQMDGVVVFSHVSGERREETAAHAARVLRIAGATLARAGFGAIRGAVVEAAGETAFVHVGSGLMISVTFGPDAEIHPGMALSERLLSTCVEELRRRHDA